MHRLTVPTTSAKWTAFKAALYDEYPESDPRERMRLRDLEALVTETSRQQSFSKANFEDYSREFNTLADFLIAQGVYDESEAKRAYVQGLPSSLRDSLMQYLSLVCMDQSPLHGYDRNLVRRMTRHWFETRAVLSPPTPAREPPAPAEVPLDALPRLFEHLSSVLMRQLEQYTPPTRKSTPVSSIAAEPVVSRIIPAPVCAPPTPPPTPPAQPSSPPPHEQKETPDLSHTTDDQPVQTSAFVSSSLSSPLLRLVSDSPALEAPHPRSSMPSSFPLAFSGF